MHAKNGVPLKLPSPSASPIDPPEGGEAAELAALVALFPPLAGVRALRKSFDSFDRLFRHVPAAVARRADALAAQVPSVGREDAPLLALLAAMCLVGALCEEREARSLRRLTDGLLRHCTTYGPHSTDYAHAATIACTAELTGAASSPARAWVAVGTARAALLLARTHLDHDESLWERERRRRVWYQGYIAQA